MLLTLPLLLTFVSSQNVVYGVPQVDFDRMGTVGLAGAFAGLDLFHNSSVSFDSTTSTLLSRSSDGSLTSLASTNPGGGILAGCTLGDTFYFSGSFTSINGVSASNVASYKPSSGSFASLGSNGPNGEVGAIFCDAKNSKVWVGGNFTSPASSVAVWNVPTDMWVQPPFSGLTGAQAKVNSITTNSSQTSLFFAGSFTTSFGTSALNRTNNPNVPFSAGATPFSSSLVPVPLGQAEIDGSPSSDATGFSDIHNILCPSGPDGAGNTWLAADQNAAVITIRTFSFISANGVRLGNTFQNNHGTTGFTVTTIPDNNVQTLQYIDPTTGQNTTCSNPCPLSTDASILYQDFLFPSSMSITGVQIKLSEFTGASPGLHLLQLLSSGAFASSVEANNGVSCFAPNPSNTTSTGQWVAKVANTNIAGTIQTVLTSVVEVGTSTSAGPSFTWIPYVSAAGNYDINLLIPGCTNLQDCAMRTTVKVTVFPGEGLQPVVSTISQQNTADTAALIYSGPILPSSPAFVTTISMSLADTPVGTGQSGQYELVADRVELVLRSSNISASSGGANGSTQGAHRGFGFLEWPLNFPAVTSGGTTGLPNSTLTSLDSLGFDLLNGLGGIVTSNNVIINAVAHHASGAIFFGGAFSLTSGAASGSSNIAIFKNGALSPLAESGLDGPVTSFALYGDQLFVGGSFRDTISGSTHGSLAGVALYNVQKNTWSSLGAGVNGKVNSLGLLSGQLQVVGNFTVASSDTATGIIAAGFAAWDIKSNSWVNPGGFVAGSLSFIGNGTSSQFVAGNVVASQRFGAAGMVMLKNGGSDGPQVTPLGAELGISSSQISTNSSSRRRRNHISRATSWMSQLTVSHIFSRQTNQPISLPSSVTASAPAVLAGAFWTNGSTEIVIMGGNFSFFSGSVASRGVGLYNPQSKFIRGLNGSQPNGTVRALLVDNNHLYVGGEFTIPGTNVNGLAIYDLKKDQWDITGLQPLQGISGSNVVVRSITKSATKANTVIVAGSFAQAGSLRCQSICTFDTGTIQWNSLGNGIQGEVASVAYAGKDQDTLIAAGSIALTDNVVSNVVQFSFANATWSSVGTNADLPGPMTAVEVNGGNASSIFAAGLSPDGSTTSLYFWNGIKWTTLGSSLQAGSNVAQLIMVPIQETHAGNSVIEADRLLMISGMLTDPVFGNASSALYDGQNLIPYIVSTSPTGDSGAVASLFHSFSTFSFNQHRFLAVGVVILISIAIAAGVVFLLALIGILWTLFSRKEDKVSKLEVEDDDDSTHHRPSSLLEHINAATRTTILGATPFADYNTEEKVAQDPFGPDASNYVRTETPSDAVGGMLSEEMSRPAHARYSFDGTGEGELPISAGSKVEVLDDRDPAWWYARDVQTGREGVVPAAYLY